MFLNEIMDRGLRGAFAGLLGGSVFGVWMAEKGGLPAIASMGGRDLYVKRRIDIHSVFCIRYNLHKGREHGTASQPR